MHVLKQFDLFRVVQDKDKHLTPATKHGAAATLLMLLVLVVLLIGETVNYVAGHQQCTVVPRAMMDPTLSNRSATSSPQLHAFITLPYIPCHRVAASIEGSNGPLADLSAQIQIQRYQVQRGQFRPDVSRPFKDAPDGASPTLAHDPVKSGGCYVEAVTPLADVPASFNLFVRNYNREADAALKPDHYISQLFPGTRDLAGKTKHITPATTRPLADVTRNVTHLRGQARYFYQYFLQFVETAVDTADQYLEDYQFTESWSTVFYDGERRAPGVYFSYRHSTFSVQCSETHDSPSHFAVNLCAVIGGVYIVSGFLEAVVEEGLRRRHKRAQAARNAENTAHALSEGGQGESVSA